MATTTDITRIEQLRAERDEAEARLTAEIEADREAGTVVYEETVRCLAAMHDGSEHWYEADVWVVKSPSGAVTINVDAFDEGMPDIAAVLTRGLTEALMFDIDEAVSD